MPVGVSWSELEGLVLSFHHVGSRDLIQVTGCVTDTFTHCPALAASPFKIAVY